MLFFFPRGVLDEILNLIESVSEGFPSYFYCISRSHVHKDLVKSEFNRDLKTIAPLLIRAEGRRV